MEIRLAKTAGFCFGVNRAVELTYGLLAEGHKVATLGPLIHNPQAVEDMRRKGAQVVDTVQDVPAGCEVVIRSHGVPRSVYDELAARGIRPRDLDYVLFSHLDPDHIAGISEVRGAKRLLVPEEEYFWSCRVNLRYTSRRLWIDEPPERFWYRVNHIGPESRSYDLFGDDSVHLVHIAGHTEGMFAALIRNGERYVLLNADGAASPRSWAEGTVPGICENSVRAKKALNWIGSMSRDPACVASLCSHDPDIAPQTIEF